MYKHHWCVRFAWSTLPLPLLPILDNLKTIFDGPIWTLSLSPNSHSAYRLVPHRPLSFSLSLPVSAQRLRMSCSQRHLAGTSRSRWSMQSLEILSCGCAPLHSTKASPATNESPIKHAAWWELRARPDALTVVSNAVRPLHLGAGLVSLARTIASLVPPHRLPTASRAAGHLSHARLAARLPLRPGRDPLWKGAGGPLIRTSHSDAVSARSHAAPRAATSRRSNPPRPPSALLTAPLAATPPPPARPGNHR